MNMNDFIPIGMNHSDFFIGCEFVTGAGKWGSVLKVEMATLDKQSKGIAIDK
jgi:hypothetical protein